MAAVCDDTATAEQLGAQLTAAEAAYARLMTGQQPKVVVDANGERVEFTSVTSGALNSYIRDLRLRLAAKNGCHSPAMARPFSVWF